MPATSTDGTSSGLPVIGREDVVAAVERALDQALSGVGQGLFLTGPSGIGKSHLLRVAVERARHLGFRVLLARALPEELPAPFTLVRDLLNSEVEALPSAPASNRDDRADAGIPMYLLPFLTAESTPSAPSAGSPAPERLRSDDVEGILLSLGAPTGEGIGQGPQELTTQVAEYLRTAASQHPLLLAIDDLQFADHSSLEAVYHLAEGIGQARLAIVGTVSNVPEGDLRTRALLDQIRETSSFRSVTLRPFGPTEVAEFIRWIQGGRPAPENEVLRWQAQTEGNPLFLEQVGTLDDGLRQPVGGTPPGFPGRGRSVASAGRPPGGFGPAPPRVRGRARQGVPVRRPGRGLGGDRGTRDREPRPSRPRGNPPGTGWRGVRIRQ